jgi:hypothetical protein
MQHTDKLYSAKIFLLSFNMDFNPLNAELNPICHLVALLGAHPLLHVSRIRVNIPVSAMHSSETHDKIKN